MQVTVVFKGDDDHIVYNDVVSVIYDESNTLVIRHRVGKYGDVACEYIPGRAVLAFSVGDGFSAVSA